MAKTKEPRHYPEKPRALPKGRIKKPRTQADVIKACHHTLDHVCWDTTELPLNKRLLHLVTEMGRLQESNLRLIRENQKLRDAAGAVK